MKLSQLLAKLENSKTFKDFKSDKETKDTFLCAAFIIMNVKQNIFENSLDFRDDKNIFTFKLWDADDKDVILLKDELIEGRKPLEKIEEKDLAKLKVDSDDVKKIVEKELEKNKVSNKLEEIIAVLQNQEGKLVWNLTCMCEGFAIISMSIDASEAKVIKFDKKNLLDFVSVKKVDKK